MGCIARLGCLVVLVILLCVGWFTRDHWLPARYRPHSAVSARSTTWEPLSDAGARRTQTALARLSQRTGPVFQTVSAADVASYVFQQLAKQMPPSTDSIQAMVSNDRLSMRAVVRLADLGGASALGPLASMLSDREPVQLTGTLRVVQPGLAEFQVQEAKVGQLPLPRGMIPTIIKRFDRAPRPTGIDPDALPLPIPRYVGDIRVRNGKITLYKNVD